MVRRRECQFDRLSGVFALLDAILREKIHTLRRDHHRECRSVDCEISIDELSRGDLRQVERSSHDSDPLDVAIADDELDCVLKRMHSNYRPIVRLKLEGYSIEEIAERVGRSVRHVEKVLAKARRILDEIIRDEDGDGGPQSLGAFGVSLR